ncbi:MAG TPA: hypothetical protein PKH64_01885 [Petrotogaceae bacterium]|nr:hypothetical protein [Petrotogaceae bacterium]HOG34291.1 hypothetical protein [Petrotogaceae bacterium]HPX15288.1 hypothetical protein [Petrotogaceae bacterium]HQC40355.1 hypothetical protein [Petrotogaceae bacterium]
MWKNEKINTLLVHKRAWKSIKSRKVSEEKLKQDIDDAVNELFSPNSSKNIKMISSGFFRKRLSYSKRMIFDYDYEKKFFLVYDIGNHDVYDKICEYRDLPKNLGNSFLEIAGDQFLEIKNNEKSLELIDTPDIYFFLDKVQQKIFDQRYKYSSVNFFSKTQVFKGYPGSGKTSLLSRMAFDFLKDGKEIVYITYNYELKDFLKKTLLAFNDEINREGLEHSKMEKKINNSRIYTYEEFILKEICLYIGINTSKYILYRESQEILEKLKSNKMDRTFQKIFEDVNMPMNELTRFVHAFCYTQANESNIQEYISKKLDRSGIVSYDRERLAMIKILQEYQRALDVKKKIRWYLLFEEIKEKRPMLKDKSFPAILLDEMQDLDQTEFNMLKEIFKICKKDDFLFKVAYDPNQNIEVHGSGSKNIENRLKEIDKSQKYELRYNYRNSQNIKIFSSYFINAGTELYDEFMHGNESFVQVKLTVCSDKQALEQLQKIVEIKNISLPILAYGDLCQELKKNVEGKEERMIFFNENQIKGMEFSNLVILNFLSPYIKRNKKIESIDKQKWFVGVSRAKENLLITFSTYEEYEVFLKEVTGKDMQKAGNCYCFFEDYLKAFESFETDYYEEESFEKIKMVQKNFEEELEEIINGTKSVSEKFLNSATVLINNELIFSVYNLLCRLEFTNDPRIAKLILLIVRKINGTSGKKEFNEYKNWIKILNSNDKSGLKEVYSYFLKQSMYEECQAIAEYTDSDELFLDLCEDICLKYLEEKIDINWFDNKIDSLVQKIELNLSQSVDRKKAVFLLMCEVLLKKGKKEEAVEYYYEYKEYRKIFDVFESSYSGDFKNEQSRAMILASFLNLNFKAEQIVDCFCKLYGVKDKDIGKILERLQGLLDGIDQKSLRKADIGKLEELICSIDISMFLETITISNNILKEITADGNQNCKRGS